MEFYEFTWILFSIALFLLLNYFWKNRHIYYCLWELPGPLTLPFVGSIILISSAFNDFLTTFNRICKRQKPIFKLGILNELYVVNSEPEDVEIILNTCLGKTSFYDFWNTMINNKSTLITAPVHKWKKDRKEFNRSFNTKILNLYHKTVFKYFKNAVKMLNQTCGQVQTNFLLDIWKCNMDIFLELMGDLNPQLIEQRYEILKVIVRAEEIIIEKLKKPWLMVDLIFWFSHFRDEITSIVAEADKIGKKILSIKQKQLFDDGNANLIKDDLRMKLFYNQLFLNLKTKLNNEDLRAESLMMAIAATETSAIATTTVVLTLGILPEVQIKVYEEISSVFSTTADYSLEDINQMEYLERVIKETLRILPVVPVIMRSVDQDTKLKSYLQPAGSHVIIPIEQIHKNPNLWPDPLKFDPDRFLPEEVEKRHRCAYIPFSFGPRNCIGMKFGMLSVKIMVAQIVKQFVIKTLDFNSLEDIKFEYKFMNQPKNYRIVFEKRLNNCSMD